MIAGNIKYTNKNDIPDTIPVFPLSGVLLLPGGDMPLNIFEPRYVEMVENALASDKLIGLIQPHLSLNQTKEDSPELSKIGCLGRITAMRETGEGQYLINLSGICRFEQLEEVECDHLYRSCKISPFTRDFTEEELDSEDDREMVLKALREYLDAHELNADWEILDKTDDHTLVTNLCMASQCSPAEKQALLEAEDLSQRANLLITISKFYLSEETLHTTSDRVQ